MNLISIQPKCLSLKYANCKLNIDLLCTGEITYSQSTNVPHNIERSQCKGKSISLNMNFNTSALMKFDPWAYPTIHLKDLFVLQIDLLLSCFVVLYS